MTPSPVFALSGHRGLPPEAPARIAQQLADLVPLHPGATWLSGGACGFDQLAAQVLLRLGQRVELVLPFTIEVQGARWSPAQRDALRHLAAQASAVEILGSRYHVSGYHIRNRRLLDRADVLVTFFDGRPGGTASVVREAQRRRLPIMRVGV